MPTHYHLMPVDKSTIKTRLRIHPDLLDNPAAFIHKHEIEIRTMKATWEEASEAPTLNLTLDVLAYGGIKVKLRKLSYDPLSDATIHFNPGKCLYSHNGSVLSLTEFLHALGLLVKHLQPLLNNPDDWIDLVPGLRSGGVAYWDYVEVLLHYPDPDGTLFATFRHVSPDRPQIPVRRWPDSIRIGGDKSDRLLTIYRKAVEMVAHNKLPADRLPDYKDILRFEARLKGEKLVHYLGNGRNVEEIDGKKRLVRFYPQNAVQGLRAAFSGMGGVYSSDEPLGALKPKDQLVPLGRLLARVALDPDSSQTFPELLDHLRFYTGASCVTETEKKKLSATIGKIRNAGLALLSHQSSISKDDLFSDAAYRGQHGVASAKLEQKVCHEVEDAFVHRLIYAAYQPPDQPFTPITQWPGYLRV